MSDPLLSIDGLKLGYNGTVVVPDFALDVAPGEFVSLLGPSGCGKSTVLRAIAGFLQPMAGAIRLDGRDITGLPPEQRDVGIVFQNYALFPTMTAFENIAFGLRVAGEKEREIRARVGQMAETAGIAPIPRSQARQPVGRAAAARRHRPGPDPRQPGPCCSTSRCRTSTPRCA